MLRKKIIYLFFLVIMSLPVRTLAADNLQTTAQPKILTLEQCLDWAFQNNKQLLEKEKQVAIAEGAVKEAKGGFWPTLNYQAVHEKSDVTQYQVGLAYEDHQFAAGVNPFLHL